MYTSWKEQANKLGGSMDLLYPSVNVAREDSALQRAWPTCGGDAG